MAHDHSHHHGVAAGRAGARHARALTIGLALIVAFLVVQVVTGLVTDSLALLSDAGHMATDALGLAMALAAIRLASRTNERTSRTFGLYRLEILAALANAVLLFGVAGYVLFEAVDRLREPAEVAATPVLVVGVLGLVVNIGVFLLLRQGAEESINIEGAYLEVVADMLGSIGVVIRCAVNTSISEVRVHTCRSCTSTTPGMADRSAVMSARSVPAGASCSRMRSASRPSRYALGRMNTPMAAPITGSTHVQPIVMMASAPMTTPIEPSMSATTSR